MITVEQAIHLIDAINQYGDSERRYGQADGRGYPEEEVTERDDTASRDLDEVRRLLRPHIEDPDDPALGGQYAAD